MDFISPITEKKCFFFLLFFYSVDFMLKVGATKSKYKCLYIKFIKNHKHVSKTILLITT